VKYKAILGLYIGTSTIGRVSIMTVHYERLRVKAKKLKF